jgi:ABC-type branched-subunit amino acid transport system substrate-binding protein
MGGPSEETPQAGSAGTSRLHWAWWVTLGLLGSASLFATFYAVAHRSPICIAAHNTLSGPSSAAGLEAVEAMQLYVDEANRVGGVDGHPIELVRIDDEGSADTARANVPKIATSACLAVLGHRLSTTSLAAGPGYKAARIPALTGTTHVDELTVDNPYYFRAQNTSSMQGRSVAEYLGILMGNPFVHLVTSEARFDRAFSRGFAAVYDYTRFQSWSFDSDPAIRATSVRTMAAELAQAPVNGIIVIGTGEDSLPDVLMAIRRQGIKSLVIAAAGAGHEEFLRTFDDEPEELRQPGFFSQNLYAVAPLIFDSAGTKAQAFGAAYLRKTGWTPGWIAASAYEAARIMVEALRRAKVKNGPDTVAEDRERVRSALAGMNTPERGVPGFLRILYFDAEHNMPRQIRLGYFRAGRFVSAPRQLVQVERPELLDLTDEMQKGHVVAAGDRYYWVQRVVYTGIDINRLNRLNVKDGSFNVDLNLWMRYSGDDDEPTHVEFPALLDRSNFDAGSPAEASQLGGLNYRLFRIAGDFKNNYDLHDYPFDRQQLLIRFQNRQERRELVTYVVDRFGLNLSKGNSIVPAEQGPYDALQQWRLAELRYFVDSLSNTSTLGKPSLFGNAVGTEFAGFNLAIVLQRNSEIYVIKTMIPLVLLVLVVFATLFLHANLFRERINIPVTAILTSAVLLLSVNNQLGDIGYTIAIEYIFYTFFALCLASMLIGITHHSLYAEGKKRQAAVLALAGQIFYVVTVASVIAYYWWRYGHRTV